MSITTVLLDAGGVLVFPNWRLVAGALGRQGIRADPAALAAADHHAKHQMDSDLYVRSSTDDDRWLRHFDLVFAAAGVVADARAKATAIEELRAYHRLHNLWDVVPDDVVPALARLRALGVRLVVVSNANGTVAAMFERLGLAASVDLIVDSHREGVEKPDPRLFRIALERAGADAREAIHLGDLYHVDVVGARAAGIRATLLDAADLYGAYECDRVRSLGEFVSRIENGG